jgi:hypothetical protein
VIVEIFDGVAGDVVWGPRVRAAAFPLARADRSSSESEPSGSRPDGAHAAAAPIGSSHPASRRYSATRLRFFRVIGLFSTIASPRARYVATSSSLSPWSPLLRVCAAPALRGSSVPLLPCPCPFPPCVEQWLTMPSARLREC